MFKKIIAILTILILTYQSSIPALEHSSGLPPNNKIILSSNIPASLGRTIKKVIKDSQQTIYLISDTHAALDTQKSNVKILEHILSQVSAVGSRNPALLIAIEGAAGAMDLSIFQNIENETVKDILTQHLLQKGYLNGAEYFSIYNPGHSYLFFGVDDKNLYLENRKFFDELNPSAAESINLLETASEILAANFSPKDSAAQEFISWLIKKQVLSRPGIDYFNKLAHLIPGDWQSEFPNISKLAELTEKEKNINYASLEKEQQELWQKLQQSLNNSDKEPLLLKTDSFKKGDITAGEYCQELLVLAELYNLDQNISNISIYAGVWKLLEELDQMELVAEAIRVEEKLIDTLFVNLEENSQAKLLFRLLLFREMLQLKLNRAEWEYCRINENKFRPEDINSLIASCNLTSDIKEKLQSMITNLNQMPALASAKNYYRSAAKRDFALLENTLAKMEREKINTAVLLTGGFHTEGIMKILRDKNINYFVINPRGNPTGINSYQKAMQSQKDPLRQWLLSQTNELAPVARTAAAPLEDGGLDEIVLVLVQAISDVLIVDEKAKITSEQIKSEPITIPGIPVIRGGRVIGEISVIVSTNKPTGDAQTLDIIAGPQNQFYIQVRSENTRLSMRRAIAKRMLYEQLRQQTASETKNKIGSIIRKNPQAVINILVWAGELTSRELAAAPELQQYVQVLENKISEADSAYDLMTLGDTPEAPISEQAINGAQTILNQAANNLLQLHNLNITGLAFSARLLLPDGAPLAAIVDQLRNSRNAITFVIADGSVQPAEIMSALPFAVVLDYTGMNITDPQSLLNEAGRQMYQMFPVLNPCNSYVFAANVTVTDKDNLQNLLSQAIKDILAGKGLENNLMQKLYQQLNVAVKPLTEIVSEEFQQAVRQVIGT